MGIKSIATACAVGILVSKVCFTNLYDTRASILHNDKVIVNENVDDSNRVFAKKCYRVKITDGFECYEYDSNSEDKKEEKKTFLNEVDEAIVMASQKYGVDEKLIRSLIKQESNFNPKCVSSAGAIGLMQIMPHTIKKFNVQDPYNVYENVDAGTKHLKGMIERYSGDIVKAIVAYNWGGNALDKSGFKSLDDISMLPKETRIHVTNIFNYYNNGF